MWTPFPPDGEWTQDPSWAEFLGAAVNRPEAEQGLQCLRKAIPPSKVKAFNNDSLHPLAYSYIFRASRYSLLELGTAIARFRPAQVSQRLCNAADFAGTVAELRAGLVLQALGATLEHEPVGRGKAGPDWLGHWPDGTRLALEVKCPLSSHRSELALRAVAELVQVLMSELNKMPQVRADTGTWLELTPSRETVLEATKNGTVSQATVERQGKQIAQLMGAATWPLPDGEYSAGRLGAISIKRGAGPEPRFNFSATCPKVDDEYESKRLYDDLQGAAVQLDKVTSCPGLVVVDVDRDGGILSLIGAATEIINSEPWATRVAGVLFLARDFPNGVPDCAVHFVGGPLADRASILLEHGAYCPTGGWHAHVDVFPAPSCSGWGHGSPAQ